MEKLTPSNPSLLTDIKTYPPNQYIDYKLPFVLIEFLFIPPKQLRRT
jgi:hypothetical protein